VLALVSVACDGRQAFIEANWSVMHALDLRRLLGLIAAYATFRAWRAAESPGIGWLRLSRYWGGLRSGAGALEVAPEHLEWLLRVVLVAALALTTIALLAAGNVRAPAPMDRDCDGIADSQDQCPTRAETYQGFMDEDGCPDSPDTDGDGIPDCLDACVLVAEDADGYLDADGCPEPDNDLDGILDEADKCPLEAEDLDGFQDEDGCPDPDNDGDGVPDVRDLCPNVIGPSDAPRPGCPEQSMAVLKTCEIEIQQMVFFDYNRATLQARSSLVLNAVAEVLKNNKNVAVEVQGHTDDQGSEAYNDNLSNKRAASVVRYLVQQGVQIDRLSWRGFGKRQPLVSTVGEEARAKNRRVQFVRTDPGCPLQPPPRGTP